MYYLNLFTDAATAVSPPPQLRHLTYLRGDNLVSSSSLFGGCDDERTAAAVFDGRKRTSPPLSRRVPQRDGRPAILHVFGTGFQHSTGRCTYPYLYQLLNMLSNDIKLDALNG